MSYQDAKIIAEIRAWLEDYNRARLTKDPITVARLNKSLAQLAQSISLLKSGHLRVSEKLAPVVVQIDVLHAVAASIAPIYHAHRPGAAVLARTVRELEDQIRQRLEEVTGDIVDIRNTSNDEKEDLALMASNVARIP